MSSHTLRTVAATLALAGLLVAASTGIGAVGAASSVGPADAAGAATSGTVTAGAATPDDPAAEPAGPPVSAEVRAADGDTPATHSFIQFNVSELRTAPGGTVAATVTFHNVYGAVLVVTGPDGFRYTAELSPASDAQATVRFDTAAAGRGAADALVATEGVVANATVSGAPGEALSAGAYNVSLHTAGELRAAVPLRVGDAEATPPPAAVDSPTPTPTAAPDSASSSAAASGSATATPSSTGAAPGFGVGVALAALAAATAAAVASGPRGRH